MTIAALNNPYVRPRTICFRGLAEIGDWRLKSYSVVDGPEPIHARRFEGNEDLLSATLPSPARDNLRAGVGFFIQHQATAGDYLVICWWDNRNELPIRVFVSPPAASNFAPAGPRESICVWDLDVVLWERDAFVRAARKDGLDVDTYLADVMSLDSAQGAKLELSEKANPWLA